MGIDLVWNSDFSARGVYQLTTNKQAPFARGWTGIQTPFEPKKIVIDTIEIMSNVNYDIRVNTDRLCSLLYFEGINKITWQRCICWAD